jgi:trigger factor
MKVSTEEIEDRQVVLNIEVEPEEMEKSLEGAYRRLVNRVNIRGFRKGKAPRTILERYVGRDTLLEEALEQLVPQVCNQAIQEQKIEAFDQPQVEIVQTDPAALKVVVPLPPIVELGDYREIRLISEPAEVSEEEVNAVIEGLRNQHAWWEPVERPVCPEDLVTIDVERKTEEGSIEPHQEQQYPVILESPFPMPGFAEQLIGMEKGQEKEFSLSYPSDWKVEQLAGKQYYFKVKIIEVKQKHLPEPDDEFAQSIGQGVETFDALQDGITTNLKTQAERKARREFEQKVVEAITDLAKVEFPPVLIRLEVENLLDELARGYGGGERGLENYLKFAGKTEDELREEIRPSAIKRVTQSLVLGKVAERENIEVSPAEIDARIEYLVKDTGEKAEEWRGIFGSPPGRRWIDRTLLTQKTVQQVVEIARSAPEGEGNELVERREEDGDLT